MREEGAILDLACSAADIAAPLQSARLQELDEMDLVRSTLIDWRDCGPDQWNPEQPS